MPIPTRPTVALERIAPPCGARLLMTGAQSVRAPLYVTLKEELFVYYPEANKFRHRVAELEREIYNLRRIAELEAEIEQLKEQENNFLITLAAETIEPALIPHVKHVAFPATPIPHSSNPSASITFAFTDNHTSSTSTDAATSALISTIDLVLPAPPSPSSSAEISTPASLSQSFNSPPSITLPFRSASMQMSSLSPSVTLHPQNGVDSNLDFDSLSPRYCWSFLLKLFRVSALRSKALGELIPDSKRLRPKPPDGDFWTGFLSCSSVFDPSRLKSTPHGLPYRVNPFITHWLIRPTSSQSFPVNAATSTSSATFLSSTTLRP
ncbi:hypothetical protein GALMADRAFT_1051071 [Galerina marginata CBS 339.88]|uniref:Uncharacterized protein n=1 Tax=Galerina marginata (strain CBS 339.88) TaxID=685588 RepID=A0A067SAX6_GALM3|nr:hypothetical protein GALMADRAFT_1051071 [Galerina marginata CBS 339.88]